MPTVENKVSSKQTPESELEQLEIFAGKWNIEELTAKGVINNTPIRGIAAYEWLAGKHYMISRWSSKIGDRSDIGIGIIGFDEASGQFKVNQYDNHGLAQTFMVTFRRLTWKFTGSHERMTLEFTPDGRTFTELREISQDGISWEPSYRLKGSKVN